MAIATQSGRQRLLQPTAFPDEPKWLSSGKAGMEPYKHWLPMNERRQRGWRVTCSRFDGWVWQASPRVRPYPVTLLQLLTAASWASARDDYEELLLRHVDTLLETTELDVAAKLAAELLFVFDPLDLEAVAAVANIPAETAERRLATGALPPPLFTVSGPEVWSMHQWIQIGAKRTPRQDPTGDETLSEEGVWRAGRAGRVQLCDLVAHLLERNDADGLTEVERQARELIATSTSLRAIRSVGQELATLIPLVGIDDLVQLGVSDEALEEAPPALMIKSGEHVWYREQFNREV